MSAWLQECCDQHAQRPAMVHAGHTLTYAELTATIKPYAASLSAQGVRPGLRVALLCQATPDCVFAIHALIWLGATLLPLSARQPLSALRVQLQLLESDAVLATGEALAATDLDLVVLRWQPASTAAPACVRLAPGHVITVLLTSGSTAAAKPVPLTVANHVASAAAVGERLQQTADDRWLLCLPLQHIGGLAIVVRSVLRGSSLHLLQGFDATQVRQLLAADPAITLASMVPTMLQRLLTDAPARVLSGLRALLIGGAPASAELLQRAQAALLPVLPTYGMTESCSQLATLAPEHSAKVNFMSAQGLAGKPLPGVALSMIDAQWHSLPSGQFGRILARGEMISRACIGAQSIPERWQTDGWLLTDDYGQLDADGTLYISHRHSDVIICGGENILPAEVEQELLQTGLLSDVAVIGFADAEWGQIVAALVVPQDPQMVWSSAAAAQQLTSDLEQRLRQRLDPIKIPRRWCVLAALPRGETGKLKRPDCQRLMAATATGQHSADSMEN